MEPTPIDVEKLALYDPVSAYGIMLGSPRAPFFMTAEGTFTSFSLNQLPIKAPIDTTISQRTWIQKIDYSLLLPNVFSSSVWQATYIADLKKNPGVDVRIKVLSGPKYDLAENFTPIDNVTNMFSNVWPAGWLIYPQQSIQVEYSLTQAPPAVDPNAPPYTIKMSFCGWNFLDPTIDTMCAEEAVERLKAAGIRTANIKQCKPAGR